MVNVSKGTVRHNMKKALDMHKGRKASVTRISGGSIDAVQQHACASSDALSEIRKVTQVAGEYASKDGRKMILERDVEKAIHGRC